MNKDNYTSLEQYKAKLKEAIEGMKIEAKPHEYYDNGWGDAVIKVLQLIDEL